MTAVFVLLLALWGSPLEAGRGPGGPPYRQPHIVAPRLHRYPRELSPRRRAVIVFLSLAFFFAVVFYAGRKFQRALAERDRPHDEVP